MTTTQTLQTTELAGGAGPRVSTLCLGAMPFGSTVDETTAFAILDRFVEAGGTFIDTANNYMFWAGTGDESEALVGRWLASRKAYDDVVVATKVGARPRTPGAGLEDAEGLSAKAIRSALEGSVRRLGVDHVDLYYTHIEDRSVELDETLGTLAELVSSGTVGILGCSNHPTWRLERARSIARANGWPLYQAVQLRHSYLRPRPDTKLVEWTHVHVTDELLDYAREERDITLCAYSALLSGAYRDKPLPEAYEHPGTTRRLAALDEVAAELGVTRNQVVLAWLVGGDPQVIPIVGATSLAQIDESLGAAGLELDDSQRRRLDEAA